MRRNSGQPVLSSAVGGPRVVSAGEQRPRRRASASLEVLPDGSGVVVEPDSGSAFGLNATAVAVWRLCDGRTEAEIVAALLEHFDATPAEVGQGVAALLLHLRSLGVLESAGGAGRAPGCTATATPSSTPVRAATAAQTATGSGFERLPHVTCYEIMGCRAEVASNSAEFIAALDRLNRAFVRSTPEQPQVVYQAIAHDGGRRWDLTFQGRALPRRCTSLLGAIGYVEWHLCTEAIERRHDLLHLHGAALAGPQASVLLPGAHGIGKTTFALALVQRGLRLYSDDVVFIHPDTWRPEPFPRSLLLRKGTQERLAPLGFQVRAEDRFGQYLCATALGPWDRAPGPPLRYLVFPRPAPNGRSVLEPTAAAEASVELMRYSKNLRRMPRCGLDLLPRLLEQVECFVLWRGEELGEAAELVYQLVGAASRPDESGTEATLTRRAR